MTDLYLSVKGEYFEQIVAGTKTYEYRARTPYWKKRIEGRAYRNIIILHGYPVQHDLRKRIVFPWKGYELQTIMHPHFGNKPTDVYAIKIEEPTNDL